MTEQPRIPLLIDTDVALGIEHEGRPRDIDDGFAMVEAINCADLDLLGVTTVYGNAPHQDVYRVANDILQLKQSAVPIAPGAVEPLPQQGPLPPPNEAVEFLAETLRAKPAHLVAIGPLTNIGLLVHHHPDVLDNVLSVIAVAGRSEDAAFYLGDSGPVRDFNFENDVRAAQLVLEAGLTVVLAGFELTSQVSVTENDLQAIRGRGTDTGEYFYRNSLAWCRYWTRTFPVDAGFHPWDSAAIAWLRHPEYFVTQARGWRIREVQPDTAAEARAGRSGQTRPSFWLECDPAYPGSSITYCSGFAPGGKESFVRDIVTTVY